MAEKEVVENEAKVSVDIADFFTKENSEKGVWTEPTVNGTSVGVKFLVIGAESNEAAQYLADYDKDMERIEQIKDPKQKNEETRIAMATVTSKLIKDLAAGDGVDSIKINGKPLAYSHEVVYAIMYNSISIADRIIRFSRRDSDFMGKK